MKLSKTRRVRACAGVALMASIMVSGVCPVYAGGNPGSVFELFHDKDGRAYILSDDGGIHYPHPIYIEGMSGVRDLGNNQVQLPFNNGFGH